MIITKKKLSMYLTITFVIIIILIGTILYFFQSYQNINYRLNEQQKYYDNRINNYKSTNNNNNYYDYNKINNKLNYFILII